GDSLVLPPWTTRLRRHPWECTRPTSMARGTRLDQDTAAHCASRPELVCLGRCRGGPPVSMSIPYPAQLEFNGDEHIARWRPLVQWLLGIPQLLIANALSSLR